MKLLMVMSSAGLEHMFCTSVYRWQKCIHSSKVTLKNRPFANKNLIQLSYLAKFK